LRRKPGALLPLEVSILEAGLDLAARGVPSFHGFAIAKEIKDRRDGRLLTAHGTLYRALGRMSTAGLLDSQWEDPLIASAALRPRRRLYRVTTAGEAALARQRAGSPLAVSDLQPGPAVS
jgi:DNA-binding PadR family transcriptional regulator